MQFQPYALTGHVSMPQPWRRRAIQAILAQGTFMVICLYCAHRKCHAHLTMLQGHTVYGTIELTAVNPRTLGLPVVVKDLTALKDVLYTEVSLL